MQNEFRAVHIPVEFRKSTGTKETTEWTCTQGTQRALVLLSSYTRCKQTMNQKLQMQNYLKLGILPGSSGLCEDLVKTISRLAKSQKCSATASQGGCSLPQPESWTRKSKRQMWRTGSRDQREPWREYASWVPVGRTAPPPTHTRLQGVIQETNPLKLSAPGFTPSSSLSSTLMTEWLDDNTSFSCSVVLNSLP